MQEFDLNALSVKSPCTVPWETMTGDERTRFCSQCKLNVFNLSGMTRVEAEDIIRNKEGRLCVRYVKRADGTLLTKDCAPIRAARLRRAVAFSMAAALTLIVNVAFLFSRKNERAVGRTTAFARAKQSKAYQASPHVQSMLNWTEQVVVQATPDPSYEMWGIFE